MTIKKALKQIKDELNGVERQNLTALNPRIYCFKTVEDVETRKATWVHKVVLKKDEKNSDYDHVVNTEKNVNRSVVSIQSIAHKVYTIKTHGTCLSPWYDKFKVIDINNCEPFGCKPEDIQSKNWYNER